MNDTLSMILIWFSPLIAWLPLSGKDRGGEPSVSGRAELYLLLGASAAIPAGLMRLTQFSGGATPSYETAYAFFSSLALDGFMGTLLPLAAIVFSIKMNGKPHNGSIGTARASLIIMAYCLIDGIFAYQSGSGFPALPEAVLRSIPKLAMAPVWGYLFAEKTHSNAWYRLMTATLVIGSFLIGFVAFLLRINLVGAAILPSLLMFLSALGFRYRVLEKSGITERDIEETDVSEAISVLSSSRKNPGYTVYKLMKEQRYIQARLEAEEYLERHTDLILYSWQALLRWLGGDRAYRVIFLYRYKALGDIQRRKFKSHLDDYLGEYSGIVSGWIRTLEKAEKKDSVETQRFPYHRK